MATKKAQITAEEVLALAGARKWIRVDRQALITSAIRMSNCNLMHFLKVKQGMTNQEKNDALDDAMQRWVDCLKNH